MDISQKSSGRKARIIREAYALVAEYGLPGATTARIASRCGVTEAALYHYFKNRQDILRTVLNQTAEGFLQTVTAFQDNVVDYLETVYRYVVSHPDDIKVLYAFYEGVRSTHLQRPPREPMHGDARTLLITLERLLGTGIAQGDLRDDIAHCRVAWELVGLGCTLSFAALFDLQHEFAADHSISSTLDRIKN